jgi:cation transport ATPase
MEQQPPPLSPEEFAQLSAKDYAHLGQPQTVKVFGIIHLVFGGYGVLTLLWSLVLIIFGNPFLALSGNTQAVQAQKNFENEIMGYTIVSTAIYALLTVLILAAGVMLLKGRKNALKYSNGYAWLSIVSKIVFIILSFVYVMPAYRETISSSPPTPGMTPATMEIIMVSSIIGAYVIGLIYPILSLVLLNRPTVKTWFANKTS